MAKPSELSSFLNFIENGYVYVDSQKTFQYKINIEDGITIKELFKYFFFTGLLTKHKSIEDYYVIPNKEIRNHFIS